ncbi:hypothetical protein BJ322DRAFT_1024821 [Thelephora terrestris]|uniref:Uncharacterized protein n=1 Tax=Thelephora terrestris TaxID=56493 RepID=A0A9P6L1D1_9AGAM|nr:hypothetical protein BJ322DRAFT_1024821 [Thelephora terrestris]
MPNNSQLSRGSLHLPARRKRRPYSTGKRSKAGIDSPRERPVISALCAPVVITGGTIGASNGIGSGQTLPQSVPTAYNDHEDSGAVRNRVDVVILRMTFLDILVSIPPDNVADQRRRNELIGDPIIPPKNTLDRSVGRDDFLRTYSPGETLAAVVRLEETTAVILDLESGDPRLVIVGMEISYLRATGSHDCRRWLCLLGMCPQVSLRSARSVRIRVVNRRGEQITPHQAGVPKPKSLFQLFQGQREQRTIHFRNLPSPKWRKWVVTRRWRVWSLR